MFLEGKSIHLKKSPQDIGGQQFWQNQHSWYAIVQCTCSHGNQKRDCFPLHQQATSCFNVKRQLAGINLCVVGKKRGPPNRFNSEKWGGKAIFLIYAPPSTATPLLPPHNSPVVFENFQPFQVISLLEQYEAATRKSLMNEKAIPFHSSKKPRRRRRGGRVSHQLLKRNRSLG